MADGDGDGQGDDGGWADELDAGVDRAKVPNVLAVRLRGVTPCYVFSDLAWFPLKIQNCKRGKMRIFFKIFY